ncbi:lysophospholipid acyltransferase family protein [Pedobacter insulae]|uniref:1-acyl-sn-glycerol-3-phosphate acyltransferase n=1 Tax=Pedobacter insulae TaxID=414048 RepID=A0A1I2UPW9_9SPHI|nr:lysophospholipid acyltransferase family protein [Pedobacter insulae]SFG79133.1 1-acyl-sn-glycerol-3-phosphate acyltransferase [Pedobacter insulae]
MSILKRLHYFYFIFWILLFFLLFSPLYFIFTKHPKYYTTLNKLRALNAFLCTAIAGVFFKFDFQKELDSSQTYIYCANHTSNLDIVLFCLLAKGRFHFMGKEELIKNPVLGMFFRTIDIAVSRESKISAFRAFKRAGENLEKGMSLIIFPEGKIDDQYPPVLHEFKNGPFRLAIEKSIPIVPVSSINVWKLMWDDGFKHGTRPGIGNIYIHEPISTRTLGVESAEDLRKEVFNKINSKLQR